MLLSACLIVKNESLTLARCLRSLEGLADEIIVVDTGSSDNTVQIARDHGAKVFHYNWNGDFAAARNESLKHASGKYILVIDADEYFEPNDALRMRKIVEQGLADAYYVEIVNFVGTLERHVRSSGVRVVRVFRSGFTFESPIHEQIAGQLAAAGATFYVTDVQIQHLGYLEEFVHSKNKFQRNLEVLQRVLDEEPNNFFHITNMMAEYLRANDYEQGLHWGERALEIVDSSAQPLHLVARLYMMLVETYRALGRREEAIQYAQEGAARFPTLPDFFFKHGSILVDGDHFVEAIPLFMRCREIGEVRSEVVETMPGAGSYLAAARLGEIYLLLGDLETAREWFLTSLRENPRQESVVSALTALMPTESAEVRHALLNVARLDSLCFAIHVATLVMFRRRGAWEAVDDIPARSATLHIRDRLRALRDILKNEENNSYLANYYRGLIALARGDLDTARTILSEFGEGGQRLLAPLECTTREFDLNDLLPDLLLARVDEYLFQVLPRASDRSRMLRTLLVSPLAERLSSIAWEGVFGWECDMRAQFEFQSCNIHQSMKWLERGLKFEPTIRRVVLEVDLALAHGNVDHARQVARHGRDLFSGSRAMERLCESLGVRNDRRRIPIEALLGDDEAMNPHRAYQSSALAMPLQAKLVKLHERGLECVEHAKSLGAEGELMEARKYIQYAEDIITFLRANVDVSTEAGKAADAAYAFYYRVLLKWFLQPSVAPEEYDDMREFFVSWADTWRKVHA
ncbi:glycosyltransferase family 2 protein [Alicyclobacillus mali (ex Roth et al. 2021)]|uniref:glycosyltransferase family 2 protein n=1 Tax=Alicyclobacillus mali (ex Roth et al. 2021) TaxID=1123961 RepID=UPI001A8DF5C6|nr:glycosyltransferase family 2 protein [Alicyclobacillus mali (ex Roth et al. 2021)]